MSHQNPRYNGRVTVKGPPVPAGLETAAHYLDEQLKRWHDAHKGKYSPAALTKLNELDDIVQDLYEARLLCNEVHPGDGTKILYVLAQLNAVRDHMDEVDILEKSWDVDSILRDTGNSERQEKGKRCPGEADVDVSGSLPSHMDSDGEYQVVDKNGEEEVNGGKDLGEHGVLATVQKYMKTLKLH